MDDLIAFLRVRLDDDEQAARAVVPEVGDETAGHWVAYEHRPSSPMDDPGKKVLLVGCAEPDGREWVVAEAGQWDRSPFVAAHIARHDPARVLREVGAKREILRWHSTPHTVGDDGFCVEDGGPCTHQGEAECEVCGQTGCTTVRLLALPYADYPDYREEWRP